MQQAANNKLDAEITVEGGTLELALIRVPFSTANAKLTSSSPAKVEVRSGQAIVRFLTPFILQPGKKATLSLVA